MIEQLHIKGLKCFDNADFTFGSLTLLAGKNSMGKSTVIQAILAMVQDGGNPFSGSYINIGKVSELKNKYAGSKEIELSVNDTFFKKIKDDASSAECRGDLSWELHIIYLSADRIGVRDTYEMTLDNHDRIGVKCEYAYQYLARHERDSWQGNKFVYDTDSKLTFGGRVDYWLERILGYRVRAEEIEHTDWIRRFIQFPIGMKIQDTICPCGIHGKEGISLRQRLRRLWKEMFHCSLLSWPHLLTESYVL